MSTDTLQTSIKLFTTKLWNAVLNKLANTEEPASIASQLKELRAEIPKASSITEVRELAERLLDLERAIGQTSNKHSLQGSADRIRKRLIGRYQSLVIETVNRYLKLVSGHWAITAALAAFVLSVTGFVHSVIYFTSFGISPAAYVDTFQDFVLLGFAGGIAPVVFLLSLISSLAYLLNNAIETVAGSDANELSTLAIIRSIRLINFNRVGYATLVSGGIFAVLTAADIQHFYKRHAYVEIHTKSFEVVMGRLLGSTTRYLFVGDICSAEFKKHCDGDSQGPSRVLSKAEVLCVGEECKKPMKPGTAKLGMTPSESIGLSSIMYRLGRSAVQGEEIDFRLFAKTFLGCHGIDFFRSSDFHMGAPADASETNQNLILTRVHKKGALYPERIDFSDWLEKLRKMLPNPALVLHVVGFASPESRPSANFDLSERRATWYRNNVVSGLALKKPRVGLGEPIGYGESLIVVDKNKLPEESKQSRRYVGVIACDV